MNIKQALRADPSIRMALVGAGGKTSTMFQLAKAFSGPVITTCSTHLGRNQTALADRHVIIQDPCQVSSIEIEREEVFLLTGDIHDEERISGLRSNYLDEIKKYCDLHRIPLILEADGSRKLPIKAPALHEPAIPRWSNVVVVVVGLSCLDKPFHESVVHRPEIFHRLTGVQSGEPLNAEVISRMLLHPEGGLKNIPAHAKKLVLFTQADLVDDLENMHQTVDRLLQIYNGVIFSSRRRISSQGMLNNDHMDCTLYEPLAAVILAAGGSTRFGKPKILLPWKGKPFIRNVAEIAIQAGLSPIQVVVGSQKEAVSEILNDLPVNILENPDWQTGQSTSVKVGIQSLPHHVAGAMMMLADQPHIPHELLDGMIQAYRYSQSPVVVPVIQGRKANPVLLDRRVFSPLLSIKGDVGARQIFAQFEQQEYPWYDETLLLDVDTPEDYQRLLDQAS